MNQKTISHIGIAVKDIEQSKVLFGKLFGVENFHEEYVESNKVNVASFPVGDMRIELTAAADETSPISKFLTQRGEGFHHIAFAVGNVAAEMAHLAEKGFIPLSREPAKGAHGALVAFLHPKSTNGILIELCQQDPERSE
jgi:methylmalonyl-CoA/ethylmalonyl-CoA epimerase